jgi:anaphase-promoting complex subunit 11
MKIKIKSYNAVASWRWNIKPKDKTGNETTAGDQSKSKADLSDLDAEVDDDDDDDEEEDVCGICRVAFEGTCPNCKIPGDDCPLSEQASVYRIRDTGADYSTVFGKCTHIVRLI